MTRAEPDGRALFQTQCVPCHGANGKGGPGYSRALVGGKSVDELVRFIATAMPPGKKHCSTKDASKIAPYMHDAFYSPLAQERIRPARVTLQRLTVRQFRNSVADLLTREPYAVPGDMPTGLYGEYFKGRDANPGQRAFKRIDGQVDFDFGDRAPTSDGFDPHFFTIAWQGDVLAPDTGDYEFIVKSNQSVQLWVNGWQRPLVDGSVRSRGTEENRASIFLLGGRAYPIRLVFTKATQGVDDTAQTKKRPPAKAFVKLQWVRPQHSVETIPSFCLYTQTDWPRYVPSSPFPPDDRSVGYERGNSVSKDWDDAVTNAAVEAANYMVENLDALAGTSPNDKERAQKVEVFCLRWVERAFRRPLSLAVAQVYVHGQLARSKDLDIGVRRIVILALKSPRFLFRQVGEGISSPEVSDAFGAASQLSFGLWDTIPDERLLNVARSGSLNSRANLEAEADRMSRDFRTWNKLREFLFRWLKLDEVPDIVRNAEHYPSFDTSAISDLRTSMELYLQATTWENDGTYSRLMESPDQYLNGRLAKLYGATLVESATFQAVQLDPSHRIGVITQPYLLTRFAYLDASSPIHRGVLILRNMLGRVLQPPPAAFAPLAASLHPDLTTRERVALQTKPEFCSQCHSVINPLGFSLEAFDAGGRLRQMEHGKPVDSSGSYRPKSGGVVKFTGGVDLAKYLSVSDDARSAFVEKLFQHETKQPVLAYGPATLPNLTRAFSSNGLIIRKLLSEIVLSTIPDSQRWLKVPERPR